MVSGVEELKELMHNPAFDDRSWAPNRSSKRIIDVIYSGQTIEENPSEFLDQNFNSDRNESAEFYQFF